MKGLRKGFTTGTAATAAAKAAALGLKEGYIPEKVTVVLPIGQHLPIQIHTAWLEDSWARASVIKDAGDDPDITDGVEVVVRLRPIPGKEILLRGGEGVGRVTKPGLSIPPGEPAINPVPRQMIKQAVREILPKGGFEVEISIPGGEELAQKTFNPRLGVVGGLSILGTTGIVEPKSVEALKETIRCEIDVLWYEVDKGLMCFVPGKIGEEALKRVLGPVKTVQMSNFLGFALSYAKKKGVQKVIIGGHPGKLAKVLMGYFDTHSQRSPQATAFVAKFLGLSGEFNTVEEILQTVLSGQKTARSLDDLAMAIARKIKETFKFEGVEVLLFDMKKTLLAWGKVA